MYQKMRKSLGNKRNEISEEQINTIVEMYGQTNESDEVKIFNNEDFGYYRVTVERPLRLNFQMTEERIARLDDQRAFMNLAKSRKRGENKESEIEAGKEQQETIKSVLTNMQSETVYKNREQFIDIIKDAIKETEITLRAPLLKAITIALSERGATTYVCMKNNQGSGPDSELRDTESIPLSDNIGAYFEREVVPHVPDASTDEHKTRTGYEMPITRYLYQYT